VAMPATAEAAPRRAIALVRPTAVDTGRVLRTAVAMAATAEGAPCRAIAPAPATEVAVDTDRVLRMAAEVLIAVVAARITVAAAAEASTVVAAAVPMGAAEEGAADLLETCLSATRKATRSAGQSHEDFATAAGSETRTQ